MDNVGSTPGRSFRTPSRPRLRGPVLLRSPTEVQVGTDPPSAVVLDTVDAEALACWLRQVDGTRTTDELTSLAAGRLPDVSALPHVVRLLGALADHALVGEGLGHDRRRWSSAQVRVVGAGPVAGRVADQLAAAGVGTLVLVDDRLAAHVDPTAPTRAHAVRNRLGRRHPATVVRVVNHWSTPETESDLTVIATDTLECDRGLTDCLLRADQTHLLVRPAARGAVVGPAVRPGRSPCVHCLDLTRRDLDARWPQLLAQLVGRTGEATGATIAWAAATTTTQALALLDHTAAETLGATLELSADDHLVRKRRWAAHPMCGCHWGQAAEWTHEPGCPPTTSRSG
ncbi:MAG: ThiF family adenylyltransferase [Propionibacteriaceae bacterium]